MGSLSRDWLTMSLSSKRMKSDDGASAVEFALVLPILVLLLVGIIQFGHLFFQWLEITHAAREGVRWAALRNDETSTKAKVIAAAPGLKPALTAEQIVVDPPVTEGKTGQPVRVTVTYQTPLFAPLMQEIFGTGLATTFTLRSAAVQRIE